MIEMKKIIFVGLIAVFSALGIFVIPEKQENNMISSSTEFQEKEKEMEEVKDVQSIGETEISQEKTEEATTKAESVIPKETNEKYEEVDNLVIEQKTDNKTQITANEDKKTDVKDEETHQVEQDIPVQEESKQEVVEEEKEITQKSDNSQEDTEYQNLLKQVEYSTYEECMKAGFDIAFSDTVNILGFDPIEIIYKGQIIGYKLKIHYTNPMGN